MFGPYLHTISITLLHAFYSTGSDHFIAHITIITTTAFAIQNGIGDGNAMGCCKLNVNANGIPNPRRTPPRSKIIILAT